MRKGYYLWGILIVLICFPLWMWLAWVFTPKKKMVVAIIDKTVLNQEAQEHESLTWLLNHYRFSKTATSLYDKSRDYFGFFPEDRQKYKLKGLERYSDNQIKQLSADADMVYITDTYGIYMNEWYAGTAAPERSGIVYGGLSKQDLQLLKYMKSRGKLIVAEFNSIGSPTADHLRKDFENTFKMRWTGWTGRYFSSLDTAVNKELPKWLVKNYRRANGGKWPFTKAGVAFVNINDSVVILEEGRDLLKAMPMIRSTGLGARMFDIPRSVRYPFWFDVISADTGNNRIGATFSLSTTPAGDKKLKNSSIPAVIPAVIFHNGPDYRFYYFSGDFCDNQVSMWASRLKGVGMLKGWMYNEKDEEDRAHFFWEFYKPMMSEILWANYQKTSGEHRN